MESWSSFCGFYTNIFEQETFTIQGTVKTTITISWLRPLCGMIEAPISHWSFENGDSINCFQSFFTAASFVIFLAALNLKYWTPLNSRKPSKNEIDQNGFAIVSANAFCTEVKSFARTKPYVQKQKRTKNILLKWEGILQVDQMPLLIFVRFSPKFSRCFLSLYRREMTYLFCFWKNIPYFQFLNGWIT